ncbi:MAG: HAD family hydrolase [Thermoplasmata archaeon]
MRTAVTFDLWHTLIYLEPPEQEEYMHRQLESATQVLEDSEPVPGTPRRDRAALKAAFELELTGAVSSAAEGRSIRPEEQLERAARSSGRVPRPQAYVRALEKTIAETPLHLAPDALSVLGELRDRGYALALISNTVGEPGRLLRPALHAFGLDEYVEAYTFSDERPWAKPAPEIFRETLREIGSEPPRAIHVGDGWSDMEGARRANLAGRILYTGLQRYGARYRELFAPPTADVVDSAYVVRALPEVVPIVERLLPVTDDERGERGS